MSGIKTLQPVLVGGDSYQRVAAAQTGAKLGGATAGKNDFLARLVITVATAATSTVTVYDGDPAGTDDVTVLTIAANTPIGVYEFEVGVRSVVGAFHVTTGAGVSVLAVGQFGGV